MGLTATLAVGALATETVAVAVAEHPALVTVTVYVPALAAVAGAIVGF